jgi:hypothetical protein
LRGTIAETGVQMESDPVKYICRNQIALLVHEPDLDVPRSLREALDLRWLISAAGKKIQVSQQVQKHMP